MIEEIIPPKVPIVFRLKARIFLQDLNKMSGLVDLENNHILFKDIRHIFKIYRIYRDFPIKNKNVRKK